MSTNQKRDNSTHSCLSVSHAQTLTCGRTFSLYEVPSFGTAYRPIFVNQKPWTNLRIDMMLSSPIHSNAACSQSHLILNSLHLLQLNWTELNWIELNWIELNWIEPLIHCTYPRISTFSVLLWNIMFSLDYWI